MNLRKEWCEQELHDNEEFVGLSYSGVNFDIVFIFYLAINGKIRSKGYGTHILDYIKEKYKGKEITLNIEKIDISFKLLLNR